MIIQVIQYLGIPLQNQIYKWKEDLFSIEKVQDISQSKLHYLFSLVQKEL